MIPVVVNPLALMAVNVSCGVAGQMLLKEGMRHVGSHVGRGFLTWLLSAALSPFVVAGLALYALTVITWLMVLSRVQLSYAYPMLGVSKVLVVFLAVLFFQEPLTWFKVAGSALVCIGVWLLGMGL
jgi:drug/metabolite transporter (DMT)-like permease